MRLGTRNARSAISGVGPIIAGSKRRTTWALAQPSHHSGEQEADGVGTGPAAAWALAQPPTILARVQIGQSLVTTDRVPVVNILAGDQIIESPSTTDGSRVVLNDNDIGSQVITDESLVVLMGKYNAMTRE